ncbi:TonB-dependent siderophore receptor [Pleionea litopenaei]|uniref:TonB-dependent siderophore receptor n=1 Tax=Pleionea litopenaei TaxID=3070815 RepID=A0AA51RSK8_9GAMM|nr:TonB-dependent siderophore receptor [Pleionea sp. HL-JVS1]WMS86743.1 TonB-dependent siderophore receptor [Pleionea sp. HL-JVS1]
MSLPVSKPTWSAICLATSFVISNTALADDDKAAEDKNKITITSKRGTIAYISASGTKDDTPIVETPMSVSVLTEKRIEDLGAETIQDALGYVAGVFNGPYGVDTRGDWSIIRGVSPVQYLDGMKMLYGYYNNVRPNPFSLGQIEVLKGPSSVLYGQGTTGGIVNLVSKRPQAEESGQVWGQIGSFDRRQIAADYTNALNDDASILFRINGLLRDSDTQTDFVSDDSYYLAPALTFFIGEDIEWTVLANVQKNESGSSTQFFPHVGTIRPAPFGQIPVERFVSEPEFDRYDTEQSSLTSIVNYDVSSDWNIRWSLRYMDSQSEYRSMYGYPFALLADDRSVSRLAYLADNELESLTSDWQLHGRFSLGATDHKFMIGLDYQTADITSRTAYGFGGLLDVYDPVYGNFDLSTLPEINGGTATTQMQQGIYLQDQIKFADGFIVSLGLRHDQSEVGAYQESGEDYSETTKRVGVMYAFNNGISPYISYSESFELQLGNDAYGNTFKPKFGEQKEIGLKYQPLGTEHLITLSRFDSVEKNRLVDDPNDPFNQIQIGEADSDGFEIEAQLEWDTLDVYATYSNTNAVDQFGEKLSALPENMASIWTTYRPFGDDNGVKVGAGVRYVGETFFRTDLDGDPNNGAEAPYNTEAYTVFDLMLGYEMGALDFSLNIDNLSDKTIITSCLSRGDCFYGQKRTITASVRYRY